MTRHWNHFLIGTFKENKGQNMKTNQRKLLVTYMFKHQTPHAQDKSG